MYKSEVVEGAVVLSPEYEMLGKITEDSQANPNEGGNTAKVKPDEGEAMVCPLENLILISADNERSSLWQFAHTYPYLIAMKLAKAVWDWITDIRNRLNGHDKDIAALKLQIDRLKQELEARLDERKK